MSEHVTDHYVPTPIFEMSQDISAIAKVLPKAQAAMGDVFKNANNPAFKSKYADLAAVVEAVVPALNANGISLLQPPGFDAGTGVVSVSTMLLHESGQWVRCTLGVPLAKRDAHGVGSAVTYGRRFGLQAMSGVAPTDDDGNAASAPGKAPESRHVEAQVPTLAERANRLERSMRDAKSHDEIVKAWGLAAKLRADLDRGDPERLVALEALLDDRQASFGRVAA